MGVLLFDAGYVCGILCSDGSIIWSEKYSNYDFSLESKDKDLAESFKVKLWRLIFKEPSLKQRIRKYKGEDYKTYVVYVYGKMQVFKFMETWGVKTGCFEWRSPKIAFNNPSFRKGFLQGFFDGEGTVRLRLRKHKNNRTQRCRTIRATLANKEALEDIKKLLEIEGVLNVIYPVGKYFVLEIDGLKRTSLFVQKINFGMKRKRVLAESMLDRSKFDEIIKSRTHKI